MWNWLRNPKNLAVLTAVASAIAFVWTKLPPASEVPPTAPSPAPTPININIDAKQTTTQTMSPPAVTRPAPVVTAPPAREVASSAAPLQKFPVRRQLATGVSNEVLPGFWLTLEGYEGTPNNMTVHLASPSWGNRDLSFKVGGPSFDFSHKESTYQLTVESMKDERVNIAIHHP